MAAEFVSNTFIQLTPELATRPVAADPQEFTIRPVSTTSTSLVAEMTDTYGTTDTTSGAEAAQQTSVSIETQKGGAPNVGLIVGSLLGTIALLGFILLGVRYWFIRRRKAHQADGSRPAYNKARFAISGPSDFRVVESGTGPALTAVGGTPLQLQPSIDSIGGRNNGTSIGGRYPFDMSTMESGLSNHVKAMKDAGVGSAARKPVPTYKSDGDNKV